MDDSTVYTSYLDFSPSERLMHSYAFQEPSQMETATFVNHTGPPPLHHAAGPRSQQAPCHSPYHSLHEYNAQSTMNTPQYVDASTPITTCVGLSQSFMHYCEPGAPSIQRIQWPPPCASDTPGIEVTQFSGTCNRLMRHYSDAGYADARPHDNHEYRSRVGYLGGPVPDASDFCSLVNAPDCYADGAVHHVGYHPENDVEFEGHSALDIPYDISAHGLRRVHALSYSGSASDTPISGYPVMSVNEALPLSPPRLAQHVPVTPQYYSSYSELSANVAFFSNASRETSTNSRAPTVQPSAVTFQARIENEHLSQAPTIFQSNYELQQSIVRRARKPRACFEEPLKPVIIPLPPPDSSSASTVPERIAYGLSPQSNTSQELPPPRISASRACSPSASPAFNYGPPTPPTLRTLSVRKATAKETKRLPSLACFFCRERKIACGRPAAGSVNPACNQCRRRANQCDYPKESLRGQHRRGTGRNVTGARGRDSDSRGST